MAILESNTDLDVKGRVLATTVPNSTGSIVTWNSTSKVFGLRTNAQIISDLGLVTSSVLNTGLATKANTNGNNLTSIQTWRDNLGIGTLNSLTTTDKSNLVNAINEVNGNAENYIPFILTRNSVTQKLLNAEKYFSTSTPGKYIVIDTGRIQHYMTAYEITVRQYGSSRGSAKFLISWQDNNANFSTIDTISCSNPDLYPSVRLAKDASTNFNCIIIETNMESLSYCTVVIDRIIGNNYGNSHTIYSAENLDNFINIRTSSYNRDSYYLDYNNLTNKPTDYITTNTNQTGLSGDKTTSGRWIFQPDSNYSFPTTGMPFATAIGRVSSGSAIVGYDDVGTIAYQIRGYSSTGIQLNLLKGNVSSLGYNISGRTNSDIVLAGGGHRPVSDFALASSIITPNNGLLTISTTSDLTGGGTFSADQPTATNVDIGLSASTLSDIQLGVTANSLVINGGVSRTSQSLNNTNDLDLIITPGYYHHTAGSQPLNTPISDAGYLEVVNNGSNAFIRQAWRSRNNRLEYQRTRGSNGNWSDWVVYYNSDNFNPSNYALVSQLPTVNDGALTLSTGTGLSGSANFTANQSGNSTFSVGIASTHKLPTTAEWNALPTTNTITRLRGTTSGTFTSGDLTLLAGANTTITQSGANITIASTNTNTTYNAGTGLSLTGTTFGQTITTSGSGTYVQSITQTTNGFQVNLGTPPNTNTTYSAGTVALLTAGTNQANRVWRADYLNQGIKAITYNPDNLTFGTGLNYNTSTGVLTSTSDSIFAYSPQGGLYTTNWSSNALGQYALAVGHAANSTAQNGTAVGSAVFTGGFGSTNVGFSSNVNKSLAGNFGTYNTNNHREAFTYGLGLQTASTWQTVIGRYNKPNGAGDIDNWTDIRNPIFILGVGQDEISRKNSISAYGDGRIGYEMDRDETYWDEYTIPDIKWIQENISGGGGGGNSIPFVNEGELIEEDGLLISGLSVKGYAVTSGTNPIGLDSIYVSNLDYVSGEYIQVDTANVYNRIVVSTSNGGRPAVSNGTISLDGNISGNDVSVITSRLSNRRMLLCIVLPNDGSEYIISDINLLGTEDIVGITMSDPTIKIVKVGSFYQKEGRLFIDVDPKII